MDPFIENDLFKYFHKKHDLILTGKEIEDIVKKCKKEDTVIDRMIEEKILQYRVINLVVLLVVVLIAYDMAIRVILGIFVLYNLLHVIYGLVKTRKANRPTRKKNVK